MWEGAGGVAMKGEGVGRSVPPGVRTGWGLGGGGASVHGACPQTVEKRNAVDPTVLLNNSASPAGGGGAGGGGGGWGGGC